MAHKNYLKGVRLERNMVNFAREQGMIAFRSAGSHSPCDVCLIDTQNKKIYFIQGKAGKLSDNARKRIKATLPQEDEYLINSWVISDIREFKKRFTMKSE